MVNLLSSTSTQRRPGLGFMTASAPATYVSSPRIRLASPPILDLTLVVSARYWHPGLYSPGDAYMATSVWKGYLTFGLISIPIRLFPPRAASASA